MAVAKAEALLVYVGVKHYLQERISDPYVAVDRYFSAARLIQGTVIARRYGAI